MKCPRGEVFLPGVKLVIFYISSQVALKFVQKRSVKEFKKVGKMLVSVDTPSISCFPRERKKKAVLYTQLVKCKLKMIRVSKLCQRSLSLNISKWEDSEKC